jgi:hypothetical protein
LDDVDDDESLLAQIVEAIAAELNESFATAVGAKG